MKHTATYSPEDNKLRVYPGCRLDDDEYAALKAAGFSWAPKQGLFVAPCWTPQREDAALALCGEIGDEDKSVAERAAERAERFNTYSDRRAADAERAESAVQDICAGIPMGQPILIGHHSEKKARRKQQQIENGTRKAVNMWETAAYWERRAAAVISSANYKDRVDVRARRVKKLEADLRKYQRNIKEAQNSLNSWNAGLRDGLSIAKAKAISSRCSLFFEFPLALFPREEPISQYEGAMTLYSALDGIIDATQAAALAIPVYTRRLENYSRWKVQTERRLTYENALLVAQGYKKPEKVKTKKQSLPLLNYPAGSITYENRYRPGETIASPQAAITKAQYNSIHSDYKCTRIVENSHKVRFASVACLKRFGDFEALSGLHGYDIAAVFLTDSKVHDKPEAKEPDTPPKVARPTQHVLHYEPTEKEKRAEKIKEVTVTTVIADQLFPTPPDIAQRMFELAEVSAGMTVLEPSAGTGNLVQPIVDNVDTEILCYEHNQELCVMLQKKFPSYRVQVRCRDFLTVSEHYGAYPRIIMNPPFKNAEDIKHIQHAIKFLRPGGRLVALCANGPRQRAAFYDIAKYWEDLPAGSFNEAGTNVNVALMVLEKNI